MLFMTFCNSKLVSQKDIATLQSYFGPIQHSVATKVCHVVNRICSTLSDKSLEQLDSLSPDVSNFRLSDEQEFGKGIKFCQLTLEESDNDLDWFDPEEDDTNLALAVVFDMQYRKADNTEPKYAVAKAEASRPLQKLGIGWLKNQVENYFGSGETTAGMSLGDLTTTIFDILCSSKANDLLQNDVREIFIWQSVTFTVLFWFIFVSHVFKVNRFENIYPALIQSCNSFISLFLFGRFSIKI